jgi:hypothetical protein
VPESAERPPGKRPYRVQQLAAAREREGRIPFGCGVDVEAPLVGARHVAGAKDGPWRAGAATRVGPAGDGRARERRRRRREIPRRPSGAGRPAERAEILGLSHARLGIARVDSSPPLRGGPAWQGEREAAQRRTHTANRIPQTAPHPSPKPRNLWRSRPKVIILGDARIWDAASCPGLPIMEGALCPDIRSGRQ